MEIPPLHPILVNFTAALVPTSLVCDVLARLLNKESLRSTAWWTLCFATIVTPLTAAAGWWWLRALDGGTNSPEMSIHRWLGSALAMVFVGLCIWRWRYHHTARQPTFAYLLAAIVVVIALVIQSHLGGTLSFSALDNADSVLTPPVESKGQNEWREYINVKDLP